MLNHGVKYKIEKIKDLRSWKFPQEIIQQIQNDSLTENLENLMWQCHTDLFRFNGGSILYPFRLNLNYPFIHPLIWKEDDFPDQLKTLLWYLTNKYLIAIKIPTRRFVANLTRIFMLGRNIEKESDKNLLDFLNWFYHPTCWKQDLEKELRTTTPNPEVHTILFFRRPWNFCRNNGTILDAPLEIGTTSYKPHLNSREARIHKSYPRSVRFCENEYRELQRILCQENKTIPEDIWNNAPTTWDHYDLAPEAKEALSQYRQAASSQEHEMTSKEDIVQSTQDPYARFGGPLSQNPYEQGPSSSFQHMNTSFYGQPFNWPQPSVLANTTSENTN